MDRQEIDRIAKKMLEQISRLEFYRVAIYYGIGDDTMAALENQYADSPLVLLSNMLIHWMNTNPKITRQDFAVILSDFGILPNSVM